MLPYIGWADMAMGPLLRMLHALQDAQRVLLSCIQNGALLQLSPFTMTLCAYPLTRRKRKRRVGSISTLDLEGHGEKVGLCMMEPLWFCMQNLISMGMPIFPGSQTMGSTYRYSFYFIHNIVLIKSLDWTSDLKSLHCGLFSWVNRICS